MNVPKLACLALLALVATGTRAQDAAEPATPKPASAAAPGAPTPVQPPADYVIGADDTLHVSVWKEPDLTATLPVRPDGRISLPLLNDVPAAGLSPDATGGFHHGEIEKVYCRSPCDRGSHGDE